MAKYRIKSLSVQISGVLYRKEDGKIFDTDKRDADIKAEVEAAAKAGFLEEIPGSKKEEKKGKTKDDKGAGGSGEPGDEDLKE